jgi:alkanesulfonate monooxygenase SsuD/methylene tetrahydromethanopterin reductase-like flavin-dependent oxidoreductase (luciferase family)
VTTTYGLTLPQRGAQFGATTVDELLGLARDADASAMFDSVWVGDNFLSRPRPDSLTLLGALAALTTNVRLGVGCMASFTLRDPFTFAYQWATLDVISRGRMQLAACTGLGPSAASAAEGAVFGVTNRDRPARLEDHIDLCRRLWAGETICQPSKFHSYAGARLDVRPVQDPCPVWIAANPQGAKAVERTADRAVRIADGLMTNEVMPGMVEALRPHLDAALDRYGKARADFTLSLYHNVVVGPDRETALDEAHRYLVEYVGPTMTRGMARAWTALGTPEQCVEDLRRLEALGADVITLRFTSYDQQGQYARLVNEVMPMLRSADG